MKINLLHSPKELLEIIAIVILTFIFLYHGYSQLFPEDLDTLSKKSDASWAELEKSVQELKELKNPEEIKPPEEANPPIIYTYISYILHGLLIFFGIIILYISLALFEDADGKIQNKLEEIWIKIDDAQKFSISKHTAFVNEVSKILTKIIDFFFGYKLLSIQAIGVSGAVRIFV